jgi:hypothetical protein
MSKVLLNIKQASNYFREMRTYPPVIEFERQFLGNNALKCIMVYIGHYDHFIGQEISKSVVEILLEGFKIHKNSYQ